MNDDSPSLFVECREDGEEERGGGNPWLFNTTTTPYRKRKQSHAPSLSPGIACLFGYRGQTDGVKHPANRLTAGIGVGEAVWKRLGWRKWIVWWTSRMLGDLWIFSIFQQDDASSTLACLRWCRLIDGVKKRKFHAEGAGWWSEDSGWRIIEDLG